MHVRLKGINQITKQLADGRRETYYYAWKGGPRLNGKPGSAEFVASYNDAVARKVAPPKGRLLSILQKYQNSTDFADLAERTRKDYVGKITARGEVRRFPALRHAGRAHAWHLQGLARRAREIIAPSG
jgi:hypothetical protein